MSGQWEQEVQYYSKQSANNIKQAQICLSELEKYINHQASSHLLLDKAQEVEDKVISLVINIQKLVKFNQEKLNSNISELSSKQKASGSVPTQASEPRAYSVKDACSKLRISTSFFYKLIKLGKIKTIKVFGRRLIAADELQRILCDGC